MTKGSFDHWTIAAHDGEASSDLIDLDVDALKGVSEADKHHLNDAFGVRTIADLAANKFVRFASTIAEEAADIGHDPGPDIEWTNFFAAAPHALYHAHPNDFRLDFGPVYYRGRLDGTARVLVIGQDPAANELIGHRVFVGVSGQRIQGFLRRIAIRRDYVMMNTFLYSVFGQFFFTSLSDLTKAPEILNYRNKMLDMFVDKNPIEAIIAVGSAAKDAVERWPRGADFHIQHITHPSALNHAQLLSNWNEGLAALRPIVAPEAGVPLDNSTYGVDWVDADLELIPRHDLPFGMPDWHGVGSHATRARNDDNSTDHKRIIWKAP